MSLLTEQDPVSEVAGPERFRAAWLAARTRLDQLPADQRESVAAQTCERLLAAAQSAARRRYGLLSPQMSLAWDCLQQFDREIVTLLDDGQRLALWHSLKPEARRKLDGWRKDAAEVLIAAIGESAGSTVVEAAPRATHIDAFVTVGPQRVPPPSAALLQELMKHLHAHAQNTYHRVELLRKLLPWLLALLALTVVGVVYLSYRGMLGSLGGDIDGQDVFVVLFVGALGGILGGILSMSLTIGRGDIAQRIPELRFSRLLLAIRPLLGAVAAFPIALLAASGVVQVPSLAPTQAVFMFSVLAGFSERWFLGLIERLGADRR
jgi:hypothetical protein